MKNFYKSSNKKKHFVHRISALEIRISENITGQNIKVRNYPLALAPFLVTLTGPMKVKHANVEHVLLDLILLY